MSKINSKNTSSEVKRAFGDGALERHKDISASFEFIDVDNVEG